MKTPTALLTLSLAIAGTAFADQMAGTLQCVTANKYNGDQKKCAEANQPIVFVNDSDQRTYKLTDTDKDKVRSLVGQKVVIDGTAKGDTIEIASVSAKKD